MCRAVAFLLFCLQLLDTASAQVRKGSSMDLKFTPYAVADPKTLTRVRLLSWNGKPSVVQAHEREREQLLMAGSLDGDASAFSWKLPESFTPGGWDVSSLGDRAMATISTDPGSARCLLWYAESNQPDERRRPHTRQSGVFRGPRFVKGYSGPGKLMSAIRGDSYPPAVVIFRDPPASGAVNDPAGLFSTKSHLDQALIVRFKSHYLLFYKVWATSDEDTPIVSREIRGGQGPVRSGPLYMVRIGDDFKPRGLPQRLSGADVFEFDVDATASRIVLLGTTEKGMRFDAAVPLAETNELLWSRTEPANPAPLESPAVLASGDVFRLAIIESVPQEPPRVFIRSVTAPD